MEPVEARGDTSGAPPDRVLRLRALLKQCPRLCGSFAIVVGLLALAAWRLGRPQLTAIFQGLPVVMPNTALMAVLAGTSLTFLGPVASSKRRILLGQLCAVFAGVLAGLTIAEYVLDVDLGIDRMLLRRQERVPYGLSGPALESPAAFVAISAALSAMNQKSARGLRPAEIFALVSAIISLVALLGYLFRIAAFYGPPASLPYTGMSVPSALSALALSVGIMTARADEGVLSVLVTHDSGGIAARQLMASLVLFAPVVWVIAMGTRLGLLSAPSAAALIVLVAGVGGSALILRVSRRLSQLDAERQRAEAQLRISQERLDLALGGAQMATWDWDVMSGQVVVDPRWAEIRGVSPDELPTHVDAWVASVHPDDWPRVRTALTDHLNGRVPEYETEHRVRTSSGGWIWILARGKIVARDEHGAATRMAGTAIDITEKKRFEEGQALLAEAGAILASSLEYEQTLTSIAQLAVRDLAEVCAVDLVEDDEVRRFKVVARDPSKAWVCDVLMQVRFDRAQPHLIWKILETRQPVLLETVPPEMIEAWSRVGAYRQVFDALAIGSILAVPLLARGNPLGIIGLVRSKASSPFGPSDLRLAQALAERAALSIENARHYRAARRAVEARDSLMAIVAHDLRNPLGAILMQTAMLRRMGDQPERRTRKPVESIERAAKRMNRLIQDLLDVSSLEAGRLSIECGRVDAGRLVADAVDAQKSLAAAASLAIELDVEPDLPELWGDRERLLQIFENLIGNAVKFTGPAGRVTVGAVPRDTDVLFRVSDTGEGIDAASLPYVFDRFWQGRKALRRGAGLGLPIVKGIVEAHGGRVWAESAPGRGSSFHFTIPMAPPSQESRPRSDMAAPAASHVSIDDR